MEKNKKKIEVEEEIDEVKAFTHEQIMASLESLIDKQLVEYKKAQRVQKIKEILEDLNSSDENPKKDLD